MKFRLPGQSPNCNECTQELSERALSILKPPNLKIYLEWNINIFWGNLQIYHLDGTTLFHRIPSSNVVFIYLLFNRILFTSDFITIIITRGLLSEPSSHPLKGHKTPFSHEKNQPQILQNHCTISKIDQNFLVAQTAAGIPRSDQPFQQNP